MALEQPVEQAPQQGGEVMKQMATKLATQADVIMQAAQVLGQAGAPESATSKMAQAGQLIQAALGELGATQAPVAEGQPTETAGVANARPADLRG